MDARAFPANAAVTTAAADPWMAAMRRGDFARAWQICDAHLQARLGRGAPKHVGPRHLQNIWDGSPLVGKRVLVRCYHGLGDTVQFIRFAAPLRQIASEVIVWVQPALLRAAQDADGVDRAIPLHDGAPDLEYDVDVEIMELAHALRVGERSISVTVPYIFKRAIRPVRQTNGELTVGIVWQVENWAPHRSIPVTLLSPLSLMSGIRLLSLQIGPAADDAGRIHAQPVGIEDVQKTVARLRSIDLLITVDTFIAHLAGAIGTPVWLLLPADSDWRWMQGRSDSPWYPTMRLFRQARDGDWASVIADVVAALEHMCVRVGCRTFGTNDWM